MNENLEHIEDIYRLSPLQEVMLFQSQFAPGSGVYLEQVVFPLSGVVSSGALRQAWEHVMQRHPVLRTSLHWEDLKQPVQVVHRQLALPWEERDLSGLPVPAREQALGDYMRGDRESGFDLTRAPLMRFAWFRYGPSEHRCVWTFHHAILDGWSVQTVIGQVTTCYAALARGLPVPAQPSRPYSDYIHWLQRQDAEARVPDGVEQLVPEITRARNFRHRRQPKNDGEAREKRSPKCEDLASHLGKGSIK